MTERKKIPENFNQFYSDKFQLIIHNLKTVTFFLATASLPSISGNVNEIPTPNTNFFVGGKKTIYDTLSVSFRVDEDLTNYIEVFNWMSGINAPISTDQFKNFLQSRNNISTTQYNIYSDLSLFSLTNSFNPNIEIKFRDAFPIGLSGLDLDLTTDSVLNASVTFRYNYYEFAKK